MPAVHLIIKGKVQGVFYRASAKEIADGLHLRGWIKNTTEGDVEALIQGNEEQVQKFIEWCRQGPPKAMVTKVEIAPAVQEDFASFKILR